MLHLLKALADETRLRLLGILSQGKFTVQELTSVLGMGQSRISHHLKVLSEAGLVSVEREGTWGYYSCDPTRELLEQFWPIVRRALAENPDHRRDLGQLGPILERRRRRSREFFDRHYADWDELSRRLLPVVDYRATLLETIPQSEVLVEIGVGTGALLVQLSTLATQVVGIDHSPPMLEEARQRVAAENIGNIELRLGDMARLPVADAAADVALLNMVLHHAPDPPGVLAELRRVLGPGGLLVIADLAPHDQDWVREGLADQWLGFEPDQLQVWLDSAGFTAVRFLEMEGKDGRHGICILSAENRAPRAETG